MVEARWWHRLTAPRRIRRHAGHRGGTRPRRLPGERVLERHGVRCLRWHERHDLGGHQLSPATRIATSVTRRRRMPATRSRRPRSSPAIRLTSASTSIATATSTAPTTSRASGRRRRLHARHRLCDRDQEGRKGGANLVVMSTCHPARRVAMATLRGLRHRAQAQRPVGRWLSRARVLPRLLGLAWTADQLRFERVFFDYATHGKNLGDASLAMADDTIRYATDPTWFGTHTYSGRPSPVLPCELCL